MPSLRSPRSERALVDHADLAQSELAVGELESAGLARVGEGPAMHAEAGRSVDFAEQPQGEVVEASHGPSDTLAIVECVGGDRARIRR